MHTHIRKFIRRLRARGVDISTGEFRIAETGEFATLEDEVLRIDPREVLVPEECPEGRLLPSQSLQKDRKGDNA